MSRTYRNSPRSKIGMRYPRGSRQAKASDARAIPPSDYDDLFIASYREWKRTPAHWRRLS